MLHRRRLIPLLTVVLVIQSLAAALPHTHASVVDDEAWRTASSIESAHHCLACSVHAPVVEPTVEAGGAAGLTTNIPVSVDCDSSNVLSIDSSASPRGPPRIV
jgi:hypothetical protein